jgi:hypothetical protein
VYVVKVWSAFSLTHIYLYDKRRSEDLKRLDCSSLMQPCRASQKGQVSYHGTSVCITAIKPWNTLMRSRLVKAATRNEGPPVFVLEYDYTQRKVPSIATE